MTQRPQDDWPTGALVSTVVAACAAYSGDPPEDALTHGLARNPQATASALAALREAGLLTKAGLVDHRVDDARAVLLAHPEGRSVLDRLCRYEAIVVQAMTLAAPKAGPHALAERISVAMPLLMMAVDQHLGRPAADLAATLAVAARLVDDPPEVLVHLSELEVAACETLLDPARVQQAQSNLAASRSAAGDVDGALHLARQIASRSSDTDTIVRTAALANHAGRHDLARELLQRAWVFAEPGLDRSRVAVGLLRVQLEQGTWEQSDELLAAIVGQTLAPDRAAFALLSGPLTGGPLAQGLCEAIEAANHLGSPHRGRVFDHVVAAAHSGRVDTSALAAIALYLSSQSSKELVAMSLVAAVLQGVASPSRPQGLLAAATAADSATDGRWRLVQHVASSS